MEKTIDQMTIGELEKVIRERRRLAEKAPKLREEQKKILARLAEIEKQLAAVGQGGGRRPATKAAEKAPKKAAMRVAKPMAKAAGKRQKGVTEAVIAVVGEKPMTIAKIMAAMAAKGFTVNKRTFSVTLAKLGRDGRVAKAGRGLYCMAGKKTSTAEAPAREPRKKATAKGAAKKRTAPKPTRTAGKAGKSVKQRIVEFLQKSDDLRKAAEICKAFPDVKAGYVYNVLNSLKKDGRVTHKNGKWGEALPF